MKAKILGLLAVGLMVSAGNSVASVVYDNTTTDTLVTYFYSSGPYTELGDAITLGGTDRRLSSADVQFFNGGNAAGTFTATLRFYDSSYAQLGSDYVVNGSAINGSDILTLTFGSLNLVVPDNVIFTVAVSNVSSGLDLGLNAFEPPSVGSSDDSKLVVRSSGGSLSVGTTAAGQGNLYLRLNATGRVPTVPEPGTLALLGLGLAGLGLSRRRRTD